jgi:hypothetical protein
MKQACLHQNAFVGQVKHMKLLWLHKMHGHKLTKEVSCWMANQLIWQLLKRTPAINATHTTFVWRHRTATAPATPDNAGRLFS